ncbi:hypothetical protein EWF20_09860 [Sulfolobus sp. S-194]|uniref:hypothetical protein n=1 Tax=Sulfolobus sp. S-194 TaxID=2512240 RepID=UPI001436D51A|nr:hypothetical protein [Sulfolobus sp. S-194]QIW24425.1 hypothetical protein EWF20_09860 [Sulfolobus sp. S-194]
MYEREFTLYVDSKQVLSILSDIVLLAGISGHFAVLLAEDKSGELLPPSKVKNKTGKYIVAYLNIPDTEKEKVEVELLSVTQTITSSTQIEYILSDKNGETAQIDFFIKQDGENTILRIKVEDEEVKSFFGKKKVFEYASPEHIFEDHVLPYLRQLRRQQHIHLRFLGKIEGIPINAIKEAKKYIPVIKFGGIYIYGENLEGIYTIIDGELDNGELTIGEKRSTGINALYELLNYEKSVKVLLFDSEIDDKIYDFIKRKGLEKIFG